MLKSVTQRIALLRDSLREVIVVFLVDENWTELTEIICPPRKDLWKKRLARFPAVQESPVMTLAEAVKAEAPEAIDVVQARHGQTLRYFGLPFARVAG